MCIQKQLKQKAEQYVELFAAEVHDANKENRPIDERLWKKAVELVYLGLKAKEDSRAK
jgi:hypothetical protein